MEDELYFQFEDKFRGSREIIKDRLKVYLPFITPLKTIYPELFALDLGCGRGEWLELLKENSWKETGIDSNKSMISYCKELGFNVINEDVIEYIRTVKSETISVVTGFHIVEHLPFELLIELIKEAQRILLPGGILILETPNPENIVVGTVNFYLDPTHLHPVPAQLMVYLSEFYGFHRTKILRLQEPSEIISSQSTNLLNVLNHVSPDYSIVTQKNAQSNILDMFDDIFLKEYGVSLETLARRYDTQQEAMVNKLFTEVGNIKNEIYGVQADFIVNVEAERDRLLTDLNGVRTDLQILRKDLRNVSNERNRLKTRLINIQVDRDAIKEKLIQTQSELERIQTQLELVQADRDAIQTQLDNIQAERDQIRIQLDEVWADREAVRAELDHVYHSRSYRITAPLRAIFGFGRILRDRILHTHRIEKEDLFQSIQFPNNLPESESITSLRTYAQSQSTSTINSIKNSFGHEFYSNQPDQITDFNLDEIMEKIRLEVESRKVQTAQVNDYSAITVKETKLFRLIKNIQFISQKMPFYKQIYSAAIKIKPYIPKYYQQNLIVSDFLKYNDEEFIKNAYEKILLRKPDKDGYLYYLTALRNGRLNKIEILGRLRYSKEGKQTRVKIKGLLYRFVIKSIFKT